MCSGDGRKGALLLVPEPKHNPHAGPPDLILSGLSCLKGFAPEIMDERDGKEDFRAEVSMGSEV